MTGLRPIAAVLWLLTGCTSSHGLDPKPLTELLGYEEQRFIGEEPLKSIAPRSSGHSTRKLGLYLKPTGFFTREFEWSDSDRETVLSWAKALRSDGIAGDANLIPQSSLKGNTLTELRESAARYGADLLLIMDAAASIDRYNNREAALLYWTILGAYLVDGTHSDALCLIRASVWDVKSGTHLLTDEAQATAHQLGPAVMVEDRATVSQACQQALKQLLTSMKTRLGHPQNP